MLIMDKQFVANAEEWLEKAIEADERNGMRWSLASDYALYAELFRRKGEKAKGKEKLGKAIEIFKECGADGWVKRYEEELASLS